MRVWELAEELRVLSRDVLALIGPYDPYVASHFQSVPRQALDAIRAAPPEPRWQEGEYYQWHKPRPGFAPAVPALALGPSAGPGVSAGDGGLGRPRRYRRRPGPRPVSFEPEYEVDRYGDGSNPTDELRYEPIWSTRDVARFLVIEAATVRQWVRRGHLQPCGTEGASHVFEREVVLAAIDAIEERRRPAARPVKPPSTTAGGAPSADPANELAVHLARSDRRRPRTSARSRQPSDVPSAGVGVTALHRLAMVTPDSVVTTAETAALLGLSASTIRSWVRRGHLTPTRSPKRAADTGAGSAGLSFRLADIYQASRRR